MSDGKFIGKILTDKAKENYYLELQLGTAKALLKEAKNLLDYYDEANRKAGSMGSLVKQTRCFLNSADLEKILKTAR